MERWSGRTAEGAVKIGWNMETEVWRDITGYEGKYQVSNFGRVRSLPVKSRTKYFSGNVLSLSTDRIGYLVVGLSRKTYKVHRLVANAFIENPNACPCVNHIDENKKNNRADNLEWCTHKQNNNHGTRNKRISQNKGKEIIQYDLEGNEVKRWRSIAQAAEHCGVKRWTICGCINGRQHTSCGFKWGYPSE